MSAGAGPKRAMVGSITCRPGRGDEMAAVLARMVDAARGEPGVEVYSYHRDEGDTFWFFALMADGSALAAHGQTEAMRAAMAEFGPLMAEPPQMSVLTPVAAVGLEL